jgi:Cu/Ag efflux pump CusA
MPCGRRSPAGCGFRPGMFVDVGGRVEQQARATRALLLAIAVALAGVLVLVSVALESGADAGLECRSAVL